MAFSVPFYFKVSSSRRNLSSSLWNKPIYSLHLHFDLLLLNNLKISTKNLSRYSELSNKICDHCHFLVKKNKIKDTYWYTNTTIKWCAHVSVCVHLHVYIHWTDRAYKPRKVACLSEGKHWFKTFTTLQLYSIMQKSLCDNPEEKSGIPKAVCDCTQQHPGNSCNGTICITFAFPLNHFSNMERGYLLHG